MIGCWSRQSLKLRKGNGRGLHLRTKSDLLCDGRTGKDVSNEKDDRSSHTECRVLLLIHRFKRKHRQSKTQDWEA
jgi:hypothetical protein